MPFIRRIYEPTLHVVIAVVAKEIFDGQGTIKTDASRMRAYTTTITTITATRITTIVTTTNNKNTIKSNNINSLTLTLILALTFICILHNGLKHIGGKHSRG